MTQARDGEQTQVCLGPGGAAAAAAAEGEDEEMDQSGAWWSLHHPEANERKSERKDKTATEVGWRE